MIKLIYSVLAFAILYKITDPNLKNVFNFSDRYFMTIIPGYTKSYLNNKWNYELDNLENVELSYSFLEKINYVVNDYNNTEQCRYNLLLNGKKYRVAGVFELSNRIRDDLKLNKPIKYYRTTFQKIAVELVDQLPKKYVPYKIAIAEKNIREGILVSGIEKNIAFIIRLLRHKIKSIKFTDKELDYDGVEFSLEEEKIINYDFDNWNIIHDYTVDTLN